MWHCFGCHNLIDLQLYKVFNHNVLRNHLFIACPLWAFDAPRSSVSKMFSPTSSSRTPADEIAAIERLPTRCSRTEREVLHLPHLRTATSIARSRAFGPKQFRLYPSADVTEQPEAERYHGNPDCELHEKKPKRTRNDQ